MAEITLCESQVLEPQGIKVGRRLGSAVFDAKKDDGTSVVLKAGSNLPLRNVLVNNEHAVFKSIPPHANICRPFDYFMANSISGEIPVLAFPYIDGKGLDEAVLLYSCEDDGDKKFFKALSGGLAGLKHIHDNGFLHLDIKPQNIMVDNSGAGILIDLGGSRRMNGDCPSDLANMSYGTLDYFPPELVALKNLSARSDVYQFGATILSCLCGKTFYPLSGIGGCILPDYHRPFDLNDVCPSLKEYPDLKVFLQRARSKNPEQRPSVDDLSALVNEHAKYFSARPDHARLLPKNTYVRGQLEDYDEDVNI